METEPDYLHDCNLKAVIFDGMALVNKLEVTRNMKSCKYLKYVILDICRYIKREASTNWNYHKCLLFMQILLYGSIYKYYNNSKLFLIYRFKEVPTLIAKFGSAIARETPDC